ncbi:MAG TPA: dihydrodipicolinate synthase family protein [Gemmatimonadaceae bacterium]|nr:dihydrodipicolinate synthase family protein [Gemmatimonadaceae bacterium]
MSDMRQQDWQGVFPAITTPFDARGAVELDALADHVRWLAGHGCRGIVALGSLGEANTLRLEEKVAILERCRAELEPRTPVVAGIAGMGTAECVALARAAERAGCDGLMVLPPYVYRGDWRESDAHFSAVIAATGLSCMLYNNPIAYGTDVSAAQLAELAARHANLHAVKESSGDVRRVSAIRERLGDRLAIFAGLDDMIVEAVAVGARGWVAGLVNALPEESVRLFDLAAAGRMPEALALYDWFLPLLRMDTTPKFVQLIKLVQAAVGRGSPAVRPPRLELAGAELEAARALIAERLAARPAATPAGRDGALSAAR